MLSAYKPVNTLLSLHLTFRCGFAAVHISLDRVVSRHSSLRCSETTFSGGSHIRLFVHFAYLEWFAFVLKWVRILIYSPIPTILARVVESARWQLRIQHRAPVARAMKRVCTKRRHLTPTREKSKGNKQIWKKIYFASFVSEYMKN